MHKRILPNIIHKKVSGEERIQENAFPRNI